MKCPNCGAEVADDARTCNSCGASLVPIVPDASVPDATVAETPSIPPPSPDFTPGPVVSPVEPILQPVSDFDVVLPVMTPGTGGGNSSSLGTISLILGIIGLIFSCVGCGGIFSIAGGILGIMAMKTPGKAQGKIGLILSIIGLVIAIIVVCVIAGSFIYSAITGNQINTY